MKVQGTSTISTLMTEYAFAKVKNDKQKVWNQEDEQGQPVQVTITEEGLDSLRKSIVEADGYSSQTYDDMIKLSDIESKCVMDLAGTYSMEMISANSKSKSLADDGSIKDKLYKSAYNYLDYYANEYDEIVKGYEEGTREIWVVDQNSEIGYRKVTKEEDLAALDKAYERNAEIAATFAITEPIAKQAITSSMQQLADIRGYKMSNVESVEEEPIDRLYERMMESRNAFKNRYSAFTTQDEAHQNISALIDEIFSAQFTR